MAIMLRMRIHRIFSHVFAFAGATTLLLTWPFQSQGDDKSLQASKAIEQDWRQAAISEGLRWQDIQQLAAEKVIMTRDELRQCFEAYMPSHQRDGTSHTSDLPYFITSDSLFQAYAWCLQKAVRGVEEIHAMQLPSYLEHLLNALPKVSAQVQGDEAKLLAAQDKALFVVGVAAALMDVPLNDLPDAIKNDVEIESIRIRLARDTWKPKRLDLPDEYSRLDYTLFKPVGLYMGDLELENYFRAVCWLKLAPFRLASETDLLSIALLNLAHNSLRDGTKNTLCNQFEDRQRRFENLTGPSHARTVIDGHLVYYREKPSKTIFTKELLSQIKEAYARHSVPWNDDQAQRDQAITSALQSMKSSQEAAYILPGSSLVDAQLIERLSQLKGPSYFPDTLSVAAWLGSEHAESIQKADVVGFGAIRESRTRLTDAESRPDLHTHTMMLLQRLFEPPPPDTPDFMKGEAWKIKTCQTALAAWAQARHVWALQAQPQYSVASGTLDWPAFIEPLPDFFSGLAGLCNEAQRLFRIETAPQEQAIFVARRLRAMAEQYISTSDFETRATILELLFGAGAPSLATNMDDPAEIQKYTQILRESAEQIEQGIAGTSYPIAMELFRRLSKSSQAPFTELAQVCLRLSALAHQQLRGLSPRKEECEWLRYFGVVLSSFTDCHFTAPKDNVPKAVRIFTNPKLGKALTVGIGRPCLLYVLYPWKGKDVLCRGAVLPYRERYELEAITDKDWHSRLHHPHNPAIEPEWLAPLRVKPRSGGR